MVHVHTVLSSFAQPKQAHWLHQSGLTDLVRTNMVAHLKTSSRVPKTAQPNADSPDLHKVANFQLYTNEEGQRAQQYG